MPSPRKKELAEMMGKGMRGGQPPGGAGSFRSTQAPNTQRRVGVQAAPRKLVRAMRGGQPRGGKGSFRSSNAPNTQRPMRAEGQRLYGKPVRVAMRGGQPPGGGGASRYAAPRAVTQRPRTQQPALPRQYQSGRTPLRYGY